MKALNPQSERPYNRPRGTTSELGDSLSVGSMRCSTMWEEVRHDLIEHFFSSLIAAAGKPLKNMFKILTFSARKTKKDSYVLFLAMGY